MITLSLCDRYLVRSLSVENSAAHREGSHGKVNGMLNMAQGPRVKDRVHSKTISLPFHFAIWRQARRDSFEIESSQVNTSGHLVPVACQTCSSSCAR